MPNEPHTIDDAVDRILRGLGFGGSWTELAPTKEEAAAEVVRVVEARLDGLRREVSLFESLVFALCIAAPTVAVYWFNREEPPPWWYWPIQWVAAFFLFGMAVVVAVYGVLGGLHDVWWDRFGREDRVLRLPFARRRSAGPSRSTSRP
jgi:hypothetical protein